MEIFNSPYETEENSSPCFTKEECQVAFKKLVAIIEQHSEDLQYALTVGRGVSFVQGRSLIIQRAVFNEYIKDELFLVADEQLLPFSTKKDLMQRVDKSSIDFPQDLERTKTGSIKYQAKYEWCVQNPNIVAPVAYPELVTVQPSELLQKGGDLLIKYLCRKFYDTTFSCGDKKIQIPYDAEITDYEILSYDFPADVVTEMLNQYGYNRCCNYTKPREVHGRRTALIFSVGFSPEDGTVIR